jgi:mannitol/fructose-specific phosphotransferase system IIA component (Ntr-type)
MVAKGIHIGDVIGSGAVVVPLEAESFDAAIGELLRPALTRAGMSANAIEACIETVLKRESAGSTASGRAALPHGRTDAVTRVIAGLGLNRDGIAGRGGTQAMLAFLSPQSAVVEHLHFLSAAAKLFRDEASVERLLEARDEAQVLAVLNALP